MTEEEVKGITEGITDALRVHLDQRFKQYEQRLAETELRLALLTKLDASNPKETKSEDR